MFKHPFLFFIVVMGLCASCQKPVTTHFGLYYWRTTMPQLDSKQQQWMDSVGVERLYLRLFDVVRDEKSAIGILPNMTLRISNEAVQQLQSRFISGKDSIPGGTSISSTSSTSSTSSISSTSYSSSWVRHLVPVVFIAPNAISKADGGKVDEMVALILERIDQVTDKNGLGRCYEIQLDFDWAVSNQQVYFQFLEAAAQRLHAQGRKLSTTIRLHQLALPAPPVDRGVLMLYNTGKLSDPDEENSILSRRSVEPYLSYVSDYALPLSLALPDYSWNVVFREGHYAFLAPGLLLNDTASFQRIDSTHWLSRRYQSIPTLVSGTVQSHQRLYPGDVIRREESSSQLNDEMLRTLSHLRPDIVEEVVYYRP